MTDMSKEAVEGRKTLPCDSDLTSEELRRLVHYDPETGLFTRLISTSSTAQAGSTAGSITSSGYVQFRLKAKQRMAHRLAWLYCHGSWPKQYIDHIDGDPTNNRLSNLREASHAENSRNRGPRSNNTSGFPGVVGPTESGRWRAQICVNGRKSHLGTFDSAEDAHEAYCAAGREHFGEFFNEAQEQSND